MKKIFVPLILRLRMLEDETYAGEDWEGDRYDEEEGEDHLDILVGENGPGDKSE